MSQSLNEAEARRFYELLRHGPEEYTELRAFVPNKIGPPVGRKFVQNVDDFIKFCKKHVKTRHVYVGLNPRKVDDGGEAEHVSRLIGIPFDVDAHHEKDTSSTDEEKAEAYERLEKLCTYFSEKGFKPPYIDDSGNGYHLIQWVDMSYQNLEEMKDRVEEYFNEAKTAFPNLDSIFDIPRIIKVPGTWALKGPGTAERPHRQAVILENGDPDPDQGLADYIFGLAVDVPHVEEEAVAPQPVEKEEEKERRTTPTWNKKWDQKRPMTTVRPFLSAMKDDVKLNNLYMAVNHKGEKLTEADIKEDYGSRSEAEFYVIMRAFHHRLLPGEIPRFMAGCEIGKWQKETKNYRDRTTKRAWWAFRSDRRRFFAGKFFVAMWMAEEIQESFRFAATAERSAVWVYNPDRGIWEDDGAEIIHEETTRRLDANFRNIHVSETIAYIRYTNYIDVAKLGGSTNTLVVENGVFNLSTNELGPFDHELYEISRIPVTYDPDAKCPKIINFLGEVLKPEDLDTIYEIFGYCLLKDYPIARVIIFVGVGGNGKSQLIDILRNFLGHENTSSLTLQQISLGTFMAAQMHGKFANLAADIPSKPIKHVGVIQTLSGGDALTVQHKYLTPFSYISYTKLIFSCNIVPPVNDTTPAWMRRIVLLEFLNVFLGGDPNTIEKIGNKISTPEELSGLLNLALTGLKRLLLQGKFTGEGTLAEKTDKWLRRSNPAQFFVAEFVTMSQDVEEVTKKDYIYQKYAQLCHAMGRIPLASDKFTKEIKRFLPYANDGKKRLVIGQTVKGKPKTESTRVWFGLTLNLAALMAEIATLKNETAARLATSTTTAEILGRRDDDPSTPTLTILPDQLERERGEESKQKGESRERESVDPSSQRPQKRLDAVPGSVQDTPAGLLVEFVTQLLSRSGGVMETILFYNTLRAAGYHRDDVDAVLRDYTQFVFTEDSVTLREEEPSDV